MKPLDAVVTDVLAALGDRGTLLDEEDAECIVIVVRHTPDGLHNVAAITGRPASSAHVVVMQTMADVRNVHDMAFDALMAAGTAHTMGKTLPTKEPS